VCACACVVCVRVNGPKYLSDPVCVCVCVCVCVGLNSRQTLCVCVCVLFIRLFVCLVCTFERRRNNWCGGMLKPNQDTMVIWGGLQGPIPLCVYG
jgi:hypothetical protein